MDLMRNWSAGIIEGPAGVFSDPCTDLRCYADDLERLRWALDFATGAVETLSDEQVSKLRETRDTLADAQRRLAAVGATDLVEVVTSSRGLTYNHTGPRATQVTTHALPQAFDSYDY
jgi:hypothetical protein